jgi:hypothetical protein
VAFSHLNLVGGDKTTHSSLYSVKGEEAIWALTSSDASVQCLFPLILITLTRYKRKRKKGIEKKEKEKEKEKEKRMKGEKNGVGGDKKD